MYLGFCNALGLGAGGIWLPQTKQLHLLVWRFSWLTNIQHHFNNPAHPLNINNLKVAGLLLLLLALGAVTNLTSKHLAIYCDNLSMVT